jgi:hypothetical protein
MTKADCVLSTSTTNTPIDTTRRRLLNIVARAAVAAAVPAVTIPASAVGADTELIALGKQIEPLVDAYYVAREPWARALMQRSRELDERFGHPKDWNFQKPQGYDAASNEIDDRGGLNMASDQFYAVFEKVEVIARAIDALPCTSIEGLRAKALVAFWEVAPLCADHTEFNFEDAHLFQRLFCTAAELCGLSGKIAATGFELPDIDFSDEDGENEGEEA